MFAFYINMFTFAFNAAPTDTTFYIFTLYLFPFTNSQSFTSVSLNLSLSHDFNAAKKLKCSSPLFA